MLEQVVSTDGTERLASSVNDEAAPASSRPRSFLEKCWLLASVAAIVWIALIGIFAIEQIKARGEVLRVIVARKTEIATRLENVRRAEHVSGTTGADPTHAREIETLSLDAERKALENEQAALSNLTDRIATLAVTGAMTTRGSLPDIACDLVMARPATIAPPAATPVVCLSPEQYRSAARLITLQHLTDRSSNGALLAVLIITAAIGGALIRISLAWGDRRPQMWRSLLRAIGGGIVCYLVLDGGQFPLTPFDVAKYTSPATASLLGLLSGMFSDKLFTLLSQLVDALIERVTPPKRGETKSKDATNPERNSDATSAPSAASSTVPITKTPDESSTRDAATERDEISKAWTPPQPSKAAAVKATLSR